jgi:hypothetical protein
MDVTPVQAALADRITPPTSDESDLIAAMVPNVASLFGPNTDSEANRLLGFITV